MYGRGDNLIVPQLNKQISNPVYNFKDFILLNINYPNEFNLIQIAIRCTFFELVLALSFVHVIYICEYSPYTFSI